MVEYRSFLGEILDENQQLRDVNLDGHIFSDSGFVGKMKSLIDVARIGLVSVADGRQAETLDLFQRDFETVFRFAAFFAKLKRIVSKKEDAWGKFAGGMAVFD